MKKSLAWILVALAAGCGPGGSDAGAPAVRSAALAAATTPTSGDAPVSAFSPAVTTLAARRPFIHFPQYTADQRQQIADEAQRLFRELYVHRFHKMEYYGAWIDPVPKMAWVVANARHLPDDVFHLTLQAIFESVRDLHQNYYFPEPYACYANELPVLFASVPDGKKGALVPPIAVQATYPSSLWDALEPDLAKIGVGDVLVSYDGLPAALAVAALVPNSDGANLSGAVERAVALLSYRSQIFQPVPAGDSVKMTFQRADQSRYDVTLPWLSIARQSCAGDGGTPPIGNGAAPLVGAPAHRSHAGAGRGVDEYQLEFAQQFHLAQLRAGRTIVGAGPEAEPIIWYGLFDLPSGHFGYLYLASFDPQVLTVTQTVDEIARILRDEFRGTDGLIIDVRDNGGGFITLADQLPQLFSAQPVQVNGFRLLNTALNAELLNSENFGEGAQWPALINAVQGTSARYTGTAQITSSATANKRSQVYFKPVAVLTNARCYSSCDMFTAAMQDNGVARIWGEQPRTGAGGANVVEDGYYQALLPGDSRFPQLPNHQVMRTAWRQTIRAGKNAGRLIEDYGVVRDADASLTLADLGDGELEQLGKIGADLAARSPAAHGTVYLAHPDGADVTVGQPIVIDATVSDTDAVDIVAKGQVIAHQVVGAGPAQLVQLATGVTPSALGFATFELRGLRGASRVWRAFARVRVVPPYAPLPAAGLSIDLASGSAAPLAIYTEGVPDADGWNVRNGKLTTTQGTSYANDTTSDAVLFLDLSARTAATLSLQATVDTEPDYDYFTVYAVVGGVRTPLARLTGPLGAQSLSFDLTPWLGGPVQLDFEFTSDEAATYSGVFIDRIAVQ